MRVVAPAGIVFAKHLLDKGRRDDAAAYEGGAAQMIPKERLARRLGTTKKAVHRSPFSGGSTAQAAAVILERAQQNVLSPCHS
jgi:hypothetical protein